MKKKQTKKEMEIIEFKFWFAEHVLKLRDKGALKYPKLKILFNYNLDIK